ncbi:MAG: P1 family peptidase [Alphaproteobacteria bacterium]|mgnify:CR=1 FL=1|nr:P1 family peptidase [Alphaproteobacteria bacterium]MBT4084885.1 P1 family peptidase [Alphaproteobacteria bacterium]MBT4544841.1 P1 family peptidase [Alphaproteobacteria bacterium]MBT5920405.1 P1 family peptidase [Alphaproteobacteria bacterium]MBT6385690.1 P1 family peptidase [Alphaproteobacteria bacterium]
MTIKPRARNLGLPFRGIPGPDNALTDIPGVLVGFTTVISGEGPLETGKGPVRTGVTAILPKGRQDRQKPVWAGQYNLNGNGEMTGTHWINEAGYFTSPICLTNTHSVGMVHHAVTGWMSRQYVSDFVDGHAWAMPVVAETYDGPANDINGRHITEQHALDAIESATSGLPAEGNVGGGAGMMTYEFKGGTGTSSRIVTIGENTWTVGTLVQSNFGARHQLSILGVPVGLEMPHEAPNTQANEPEQGSIIVVIGTDAPLLPNQLRRLAKRGALGIARTGSSGGHYSGDIILAFSVANEREANRRGLEEPPVLQSMTSVDDHYLDVIYEAAVQSVEEAIINAMVAAETVPLIKPAGKSWTAIDHEQLKKIMAKYNRLED